MEEQQRGNKELSERLSIIREKLFDITAAESQTDAEIHMVSDSIDVIADTSDTIFGITEFMKEKTGELRELSKVQKEETENIVNDICDLMEECRKMEDETQDCDLRKRLEGMVIHMENLAEVLSEHLAAGFDEFTVIAEGFDRDVEVIDHSICEFVGMSHDIQNVVREIADSVNDITEASEGLLKEFNALIEEV